MATLDVSDIPLCPEFSDSFEVLSRVEQIDDKGRLRVMPVLATALGTIYPTGDQSLQRGVDFESGAKTLTIVTTYRLKSASPGTQPDAISYRGTEYIVTGVEDYSQYGAGFVVAQASSIDEVPAQPQ